jgi:hypothetical protein
VPQVWVQDLSCHWRCISHAFTDYFRLMVVHLGIIGWQVLFYPPLPSMHSLCMQHRITWVCIKAPINTRFRESLGSPRLTLSLRRSTERLYHRRAGPRHQGL